MPRSPSDAVFRIEEARAAILFAFFRAGVTNAEIAHAVDPGAARVPSPIEAIEIRAAWPSVGHFRDEWIAFGERMSALCRVVDACGVGVLAYCYDAGAHFASEALDRSLQRAPKVPPTRRTLEDLETRIVRAGVADQWLARSERARRAFAALTRPSGRATFTARAR